MPVESAGSLQILLNNPANFADKSSDSFFACIPANKTSLN
jgi:hypothetical protein